MLTTALLQLTNGLVFGFILAIIHVLDITKIHLIWNSELGAGQ
jgi:hypothetical protein